MLDISYDISATSSQADAQYLGSQKLDRVLTLRCVLRHVRIQLRFRWDDAASLRIADESQLMSIHWPLHRQPVWVYAAS